MGVEPDVEVPAAVVAGLATDGIDVQAYVPRHLDAEHLADATYVISFGCDLPLPTAAPSSIERWDDLPMVSDGFATARDAIVARVETLVARWAEGSESTFPNMEIA
jgi:hypothetical protein